MPERIFVAVRAHRRPEGDELPDTGERRDPALLTSPSCQRWASSAKNASLLACTTLASRHAIADIWLAHQPGGVLPRRLHVPTWALVVRPLWRPTILVHSAAAHAAFVALQRGKTLNEALDAAFALDPKFDFTSQWQAWISAVAITGAVTGTAASSLSRSPEQQ